MTNWLAKKAMLAELCISGWTARRLDKKITDEVNAEHNAVADAGRYNKLLVPRASIEPIWKVSTRLRVAHMEMTMPWLSDGARILPAAMYMKYTEAMRDLRIEHTRAVEEFARNYPKHVEQRRKELNGMFREEDYPKTKDIRTRFTATLRLLPCPDSGDFRVALAKEHADDIRADIEKTMKVALQKAIEDPINRIVEKVGNMAERLQAYRPSAGKGDRAEGVFRDSLVENVRELVELLPSFNLLDDRKFERIIKDMQTKLCVYDAKELRENESAREAVAADAEDILARAQELIA
jgi:hypothetical protein